MTTALVTGAGGFTARHLVRRLRDERNLRVVGAGRNHPANARRFDRFYRLDLRDAEAVQRLIRHERPTWIFHLAAIRSGSDREVLSVNVAGTLNLLEAVRRFSPRSRVVLVGSAAEYGPIPVSRQPVAETETCRPTGAYGLGKLAATRMAELYHRRYGLKVVVARPFNLVGAGVTGEVVIGAALRRFRSVQEGRGPCRIRMGNLDSQRDFLAVEDAVDALVRIVKGQYWGEVFHLCSGQATPIREAVRSLFSHSPRPVRLQTDRTLVRRGDLPIFYGSFRKAQRAFGFCPTIPLSESLRAAWEDEFGGRP